jgi:hypothetical protein
MLAGLFKLLVNRNMSKTARFSRKCMEERIVFLFGPALLKHATRQINRSKSGNVFVNSFAVKPPAHKAFSPGI